MTEVVKKTVAFEKLSITSSDQTSSQTKNNSEKLSITSPDQTSSQTKAIVKIHFLCRIKYSLQYRRLEKVKIVLMLKQLRKKSIKPVTQVLIKAALRSIYLNC